MEEEKSVLQWGGLAGLLAGIMFTLGIVILVGFVPPPPTNPYELLARFPDVRAATIVGQTVYLSGVILSVPLFLGLYRALRGTNLATAIFGTGLALVGLTLLAAGGVPAVAFSRISEVYHDPTASAQDQATLVLIWEATQGVFNETDTMGFIFVSLGIIILGATMFRALSFGKVFGVVSVVLGLDGLIGLSLFSVDSISVAPFVLPLFIVFPLLLGWKVYRLSRVAGALAG